MFLFRYFFVLPLLLLVLLTPVVAQATTEQEITKACATAAKNGGQLPSYCSATSTTVKDDPLTGPDGLLTTVTNIIAFISGLVAVVIIIVAGGRFVLSRGDAAKIVTARQTIAYAVVGLIVIITARQLIVFVLSRI